MAVDTSRPSRVSPSVLIRALLLLSVIACGPLTWAEQEPFDEPPTTPSTAASTTEPAAEDPNVFSLQAAQTGPRVGFVSGFLYRELARQAVLIAARDGLGLPTRDGTLREWTTDGPTAAPPRLGITTTTIPYQQIRVCLTRQDHGVTSYYRLPGIAIDPNSLIMEWPSVLEQSERFSREQYVLALRRLGYDGQPNARIDDPVLPENVAELLTQMNLISQYQAVRTLHQTIRRDGESPARLGALARGYANLGILTDYFWTNVHKVFKARALLYAQRMVVATNGSPDALRHRAYCFALVGIPQQAQADLQLANDSAGPDDPPMPTWAAIAEAYTRCDYQRLSELRDAQSPDSALAGVLAVATVYYHSGAHQTEDLAAPALALAPDCMRLWQYRHRDAGVSLKHETTTRAPLLFGSSLAYHLPHTPELPDATQRRLTTLSRSFQTPAGCAAAVHALYQATRSGQDAAEPSLAVLASLIDDQNFILVYNRLDFLSDELGLGQDEIRDYARQTVRSVRFHPMGPLIRSYLLDPTDEQGRQDLLYAIHTPAIDFAAWPMFFHRNYKAAFGSKDNPLRGLYDAIGNQADAVEMDLACLIYREYRDTSKVFYAQYLHELCPDNPLAVAELLDLDWEKSRPHLDEWIARFDHHPVVIRMAVARLREMGDDDRAIELLKKYMAITDAQTPYEQMAEILLKRGDERGWLETMEQASKLPDLGLDSADILNRIAKHFMARGQFHRALSYAERAARSYAGWALQTLALCQEALGQLDDAEDIIRQISQRYETSSDLWLRWCLRLRTGREVQARELVADELERVTAGQPSTRLTPLTAATLHLLDDQTQQALDVLAASYQQRQDFDDGMFAALLANHLGQTNVRDQILETLVPAMAEKFPQWVHTYLFQALQGGWTDPQLTPAPEQLQKLIDQAEPWRRNHLSVMVGFYLLTTGHPAQAQDVLTPVVRSVNEGNTDVDWAWWIIRKAGGDPRALRQWPGDPQPPRTQPSDTQPSDAATEDPFMQEGVEPEEPQAQTTTRDAPVPGRAPAAPR